MTFNQNLPDIVSSLQQGDLRAVCDGSFDVGYGTTAWCLDGDVYIVRGINIAPIGSDTLEMLHDVNWQGYIQYYV